MHFKFSMHIHRVSQNKSTSKHFGKSIHRRNQESKKLSGHSYKAHRMVIFAVA